MLKRTAKILALVVLTLLAGLVLVNVFHTPVPVPEAGTVGTTAGTLPVEEKVLDAASQQRPRDLVLALNEAKANQAAALPVVVKLWQSDKAQYPNLNWPMVESAVVRVHLADLLVQSHRNGAAVPDIASVVQFLRSEVKGAKVTVDQGDLGTATTALLALSLLDDQSDVAAIKTAAISSDGLFNVGVIALSRMCVSEAQPALEELQNLAGERGALAEFEQTRNRSIEIRDAAGFCRRS